MRNERERRCDASVAFKWLFDEDYSNEARALYLQWRNEQTQIIAPTWFMFEITNILYQRIRRGDLMLDAAQSALDELQASPHRSDRL